MPYPFEIVLIAQRIAKATSANGPSVLPDWDFGQALDAPLSLLMVPGGAGTRPLLDEKGDPVGVASLFEWLSATDTKVRIMASVCTVLARAGARRVSCCHQPRSLGRGRPAGSESLVGQGGTWVDAEKYVTSAGTELGFYLVSRLAGRGVAEIAVAAAEYNWPRDPLAPIFIRKRPSRRCETDMIRVCGSTTNPMTRRKAGAICGLQGPYKGP